MKLPHDIIQECAGLVLPGCFYLHGEQALANVKLDQVKAARNIVYLDDKMPFRFNTNKFRQITGTTYSCLLLLLIPSEIDDSAEVRQPRIVLMVDAAARLLAALGKHEAVASVNTVRPADVLFNQFDRNADGVGLYLDITTRGGLNVCLPAEQPQV